ncbi:MAG TPA: hypothetical protein VF798_07850 [Burkholderiaceae bacterium]
MKKSVKAALWSAFAYPGIGHLVLRSNARGWALIAAFTGLLWYLIDDIFSRGLVDKVDGMLYKVLSGEVPADSATIERMLDLGPDPIGVQIASWAALACWIAGVVDSYLIGQKQDRETGPKPDMSPQTRSKQSKTE